METKQVIFETAKRSFECFGYKNTSLEQIASMARLGKSTIYHYYQSKRELFEKIVNEADDNLREITARALSEPVSLNTLFAVLHQFRDEQKNSGLICKIIEECRELGTSEATEELCRLNETILNEVQKVYAKLKALHMIEYDGDLSVLSFVTVEMYRSLVFTWPCARREWTDEEVNLHLQQFVLSSVLKNK